MTGSAAAPFLVPIIMVGLAIWLVLVFRADAHPRRGDSEAASEPKAARADGALRPADSQVSSDDRDQGSGGQAPAKVARAA
jgi:hypothetical protein